MRYWYLLSGAVLHFPATVAAASTAFQTVGPAPIEAVPPNSVPVDRVVMAKPPTVEAEPDISTPVGKPTRLLVPLIRGSRVFGDILADLYVDGNIRYVRATLIERLSPVLSPNGAVQFAAALRSGATVSPAEVEQAGIVLRYDASLLEVNVELVDPELVGVQVLGTEIEDEALPITLEPANKSAYLNILADFRFDDFSNGIGPGLLLNGAVRHRNIVFEFDGGIDSQIATGSGFYRRTARLVYDQPGKFRRFTAGDVQVATLGLLGGVFLGGFGVEKGRQVFNDFGPLTPLGGQQILLERDATVELFVSGQKAETLQLRAGPYDLGQLQAQYAGRDAKLFVTDVTGRRQIAAFDTFLDAGALTEGESRYSAALGFIPDSFGNQPTYSSSPAFSGLFGRGLSNRLTLSGALQLSRDLQVAGSEMVVSPKAIPGRFELGGAISTGKGFGMSARAGYSLRFGNREAARQVSLNAEYRSNRFATVSDRIFLGQAESFAFTANYSERLSERTTLIVGANWYERNNFRGNRSIFADVVHSTRKFRVTLGAEYGDDFFDRRFGIRASISVPLGRSTRADANYNSRRDDFRAVVTRSFEDRVGSWGYDFGVRRTQGVSGIDASGTFVGNRLYARGFATSSARSIAGIADNPNARVQIGTAIAFADGALGVGRPIVDSFVIALPHEDITDEQAILGSSVQRQRPDALSGAFGAALSGKLSSYNRQSIFYDLAGGSGGIDIGTGIETVLPPYRSGYRLIVGSGATVTAFGFLNLPTGRAELISGVVSSEDDSKFGMQPFFTNSAGRFAIIGLTPGNTYQIRLFEPAANYTIAVAEDSDTLLQLGEVTIVQEGTEQE